MTLKRGEAILSECSQFRVEKLIPVEFSNKIQGKMFAGKVKHRRQTVQFDSKRELWLFESFDQEKEEILNAEQFSNFLIKLY